MARAFASEEEEGSSANESGIVHGLRSFNKENEIALSGADNFIESLIINADRPDQIRLRRWRALLRSALYLAERDPAFNTPCWKVIRGIDPPEGIATAFDWNK